MRIDKFNGINNQSAPTEFGLGAMVDAVNYDITNGNKLRLRNGKGSRTVVAAIEAACATGEGEILYQSGTTLYLMTSGTPMAVKTGLTATNFLTCSKVNDLIMWSNGVQRGYIKAGQSYSFPYAVETGLVSQFHGNMPPGTYHCAVTYTDINGFESPTGIAKVIEVTQGAIEVQLSVPSDSKYANLYLTTANGSVLYHGTQIDVTEINGAVPSIITYSGDTLDLINPLSTQFCDAPPAFSMAGFYKGRMYYVFENLLLASKPLNYAVIDYAYDYNAFPAHIRLMMPAESGIYVATDNETVFLSGTGPQDFALNKVLDYGGIQGTAKRIYASTLQQGQAGNVWLWASNRGQMAGFDDGSVSNLTDGVFAYPDALKGTSALREENGMRQLLITVTNG